MQFTLSTTVAALALGLLACDDEPRAASDTDTTDAADSVDASETRPDASEGPDDVAEGKPETTGGTGVMTDPEAVQTSDISGAKRTLVNAESSATWTYFSFDTGALRNPDAAESWDLGIQRYLIKLGAGVTAATLDGQDFAALTTAPADGYATDLEGATTSSELALGQWYDYDPARHTLSPTAGRVYVVKLASGSYYKVALRDYYDAAGSSGFVTFDWAEVEPPGATPNDVIRIAAGSDLYVDLASHTFVSADGGWDIVFRASYVIGTASGTSAPGLGGARLASEPWEALSATDTVGFSVDSSGNGMAGPANAHAALSAWFDYDPETHTATVADKVFVVRGRTGAYYKLRATSLTPTGSTFQVAPIDRAPSDHELVLDPSAGRIYASLARGTMVTSSETWDLALASVSFQTNGGTSGEGAGGAKVLGTDAFGSYTALSASDLIVDALQPIAGPPGSGDESRNSALDAWWSYDPATHTVSATPSVFVIALADGSLARATVAAYAEGKLTLRYTYAGPGHESL